MVQLALLVVTFYALIFSSILTEAKPPMPSRKNTIYFVFSQSSQGRRAYICKGPDWLVRCWNLEDDYSLKIESTG
nr:unnamed protein product [Haemonchus contortus]